MITLDEVRHAQRSAPNAPETRALQRLFDTQGRETPRMVFHRPRKGWVDDIVIDIQTGEVLGMSASGFGPFLHAIAGGGDRDTFIRRAQVGDRICGDLKKLAEEHGLKIVPISEAKLG